MIYRAIPFTLIALFLFNALPAQTNNIDRNQAEELYNQLVRPLPLNSQEHLSKKTSYRLSTRLVQSFNSGWITGDSILYTYIKDFERDQVNHWRRPGVGGGLENNLRSTFSYDTQGRVTRETEMHKINGVFINYRQVFFTYDSLSGLISSFTRQIWDNGNWVNDYQEQSTYDVNGNRDSLTVLYWDSGTWINNTTTIYTWNINNELDSQLRQKWDTVSMQWVNQSFGDIIYLPNGELDSSYTYAWQGNNWVDVTRVDFTLNADNFVSQIFIEIYDSPSIGWRNSRLVKYSYADIGKTDTIENIFWNTADSAWKNLNLTTYTYDVHGNTTLWTFSIWSSITNSYLFQSNNISSFEVFQSTAVDGLVTLLPHLVFPNPASESVKITFDSDYNVPPSLEIYNPSGQLIYSRDGHLSQQEFTWDRVGLNGIHSPPGLYTYRLIVGEKRGSGKILITD